MNDLGIVLYKVCVFVPIWNSKMATTILENDGTILQCLFSFRPVQQMQSDDKS
jgi:hypothetical protein